MKKIFNKNVIIALVVVLGLGLLYWGIEFLKGANLFESANYYITKFDNVSGLNVSTPVTVNGYQVGLIKELDYDYKTNRITVKMRLDDELKIPVGSSVQLSSELLGGATLSINLANNTAYYKVGDEIPSVTKGGLLDKVGQDIMPEVNEIMPKVNDILGNVNALVANPSLQGSVSQFDDVVSKINASAQDLKVLLGNLNQLSGGLNGSVPEVMNGVVGIERKVDGTVTDLHNNLNTLTSNINTKVSELPTQKLETTINELNGTIAELKGLTSDLKSKLNDRNSSIGLLLNDRQLYDNANGAVMSLDSLLNDIKANPKRYITIKVF
jgi:phospholipid/cholesterol/gamma-HCH transport system substrate-binding protein